MPVVFWLCVCWCVGCALCFGVWLVCAGGCMIFCSCFLVLGFASSGPGTVFCFVFWLGLGFSRPGFDLFVESLILAQDERWRRA